MEIPVKEIVNAELTKLGFKRSGLNWYKHYNEVIHVVALQKSSGGNSYYINLAVWVNKLGSIEQPKCRECHLQVRLGSIDGSPIEIDAALVKQLVKNRPRINLAVTKSLTELIVNEL